jgi:hypothetical protein
MRRTERQPFGLDPSFLRPLEFAPRPATRHEPELYQAGDRIGAGAEGDGSNWETLWIDLGGEG